MRLGHIMVVVPADQRLQTLREIRISHHQSRTRRNERSYQQTNSNVIDDHQVR